VITSSQLEQALEEQKRSGKRLGEVIEDLHLVPGHVIESKIREQQASAAAD